jgi:hypothetical protein
MASWIHAKTLTHSETEVERRKSTGGLSGSAINGATDTEDKRQFQERSGEITWKSRRQEGRPCESRQDDAGATERQCK